jgi:hypothetical protein
MKSLNAKRIAAIVTGAALLGAGLAFAGPLTIQNVPIISNSGQPVVQVVIGAAAKPSDGVAAGNIAAAIGNLAYTSTPVTAWVNPNSTSALSVSVSSSKYSLTNQQVWLNESGVTSATGASYLFSALIGSMFNQGVQLGASQNTKATQGSGSYAFPESYYTTNSPVASPYTGVGSVPVSSSVTSSNGGGVTFSSFTSAGNDNILQVTSSQFSSLATNWGANGETESLFLTGFPVFNQQSSVNNFALMDAGGAYQVIFTKPIANRTSSNSININVPIRLLGVNYTIINGTGVSGTLTATSTYKLGGTIYLASSATPLQTIYVGHNLTSGPWTVQLQDLAQTMNGLNAPAAVAIYYNGQATNETSVNVWTGTTKFNVSGHLLFLNINSTFAGLYAYQKWAKMQLYNNVYKVTNNQQFNKTNDPGWNAELLWTNTTSSSGKVDQLYGIVLYNVTPTMLTPGQSFSFIQNPSTYKLTFVGDTLGNNFDTVTAQLSTVSGVNYADSVSGGGTSITNITEPAQELTVTSQIPNAFSYAGQTSDTVVYDLTPYALTGLSNTMALNALGATYGSNAVLTYIDPTTATGANTPWISTGTPISITVIGYSQSGKSYTQQSATFSYNTTASGTHTVSNVIVLGTPLYNVTAIQIQGNRALPIFPTTGALSFSVTTSNGIATNSVTLATLSAAAYSAPTVLYTQSGQTYLSTSTSATSVNYNQQNGQPISNAILAPAAAVSAGNVIHETFTYQVGEVSVPANTLALDYLGVGIYNNSVSATPTYVMNYSKSGQHNNVTYTSTQGQTVNIQTGFRTEKGSKVGSITASKDTFDMATSIDQLQFAVTTTASNSVVSKAYKSFGPYSVGQATNLPNVTIGAVSATPVLSGSSIYTILGVANLTATPSVTQATTPVWLKNLSSTAPLVVLNSTANAGSNLILVGSGYVNSLSAQLETAYNLTGQITASANPIVQAYGGNRILVAGYTADQTMSAANSFISQLYAAAGSST